MLHRDGQKRVLLLAPQPFFENRGTPINVRALTKHLSSQGYLVDLLCYPLGKQVDISPAKIYRSLRIPFIYSVPPGPSVRKLVLDAGFTVTALWLALTRRYHLFHGVEEAGIIAVFLGLMTGKRAVYDMDSNITEQLESSRFLTWKPLLKAISGLEKFCMNRADAVLSVCTDLSDYASGVVGKEKVFQIEDFPLAGACDVEPEFRKEIVERYNLGSVKTFVYTGNFETYQGVDLLIEAFASMPEDYRLLLVGGGERRSLLEGKVKELGEEDRVIFAGAHEPSKMGTFMNLADVLVSPRMHGGNTPLKLYSYMASGKPVVATRIVSHTTVLTDDEAFLAEPDVESLRLQLELSVNNPEESARRAANARKLVEDNYSEEQFSRKLGNLYNFVFTGKDNRLAVTPTG